MRTLLCAYCRWKEALHAHHASNGCDKETQSALWGNFNEAWENFRAVMRGVSNKIGHPISGQHCVACSTTCRGVAGDACLKLVHLRTAAKTQGSRVPRAVGAPTPFLPEQQVMDDQAARKKAGIKKSDVLSRSPACDNLFRSAAAAPPGGGRRSKTYDIQGIAALVCRHQQARLSCAVRSRCPFFL